MIEKGIWREMKREKRGREGGRETGRDEERGRKKTRFQKPRYILSLVRPIVKKDLNIKSKFHDHFFILIWL